MPHRPPPPRERDPRAAGRLTVPDARALVALVALTLALAGLLAVEAEQLRDSRRAASARVLREHLAATGRESLDAVARAAAAALDDALGAAVRARAATPYDVLTPPAALEALAAARTGSASNTLACGGRPPAWVRVDLRDGSYAAAGAALPAGVARWARDTARAAVRAGLAPPADQAGTPAYVVLTGRGAAAGWAMGMGVQRAPFDAPIAAYGVVTCAGAFGRPLLAAARRGEPGAALDAALADSLLAVSVHDGAGALLGALGTPVGGPNVAERRAAGLALRAAAGPGATRRVVVRDRGRGRLLALGGLATLTGAVAAAGFRQLRRAQELVHLRADFTSSVSHELRTPLAQIRLFGETLALGRLRTDDERRQAAEAIVREARRLEQMVENVLHVARAERRAEGGRGESVALAELAHDVAGGFAPLAGGARLAVDVPPGLAAVADAGALRQVLLNLLDNAVRHGPPGQTVAVGADAGGADAAGAGGASRVRLWVDDEGPGIPPADRARVWEPFVRLAHEPAGGAGGRRSGSGLGLAVVADVARRLGGSAWIDDAPGGGARVGITLPA